ncbi:MAG: hypothetical protein ACYDH2_06300 [Anaerolineaceae bacterium]
MKIAYTVLAVISILFVLFTLICGLWIKTHPDPASTQFHMRLGIGTVVFSIITMIIGFLK